MTFDFGDFKNVENHSTGKKGGFTITRTANGNRICLSRKMGEELKLFKPKAEKSDKELQFFLSEDMLVIGVDIREGAPSFKVSGTSAKPIVYSSQLAKAILGVAEKEVELNKTISFPDWKDDEVEGKPVILVDLK